MSSLIKNKGIILDRDGTINCPPPDGCYITNPDELKLLPDAADGLRLLADAGYTLAVATNQSCVAKGIATSAQIDSVNSRLEHLLYNEGVSLAKIYVCPHMDSDACKCRKPKDRLFLRAIDELALEVNSSWGVGDMPRDIIAARAASLKTCFLDKLSGDCAIIPTPLTRAQLQPSLISANLVEFAKKLIT